MNTTTIRTPSGCRKGRNEVMLDEVIGNAGYENDEDGAWLMSDDDADWWDDWSDRQERIEKACAASAEAGRAVARVYSEESDYEMAQRIACDLLDIEY